MPLDEDPPQAAIRLTEVAPFRIGALDVRPATREVERAGVAELLEPRVMQVLVALARANGAVVSRDQLVATCWGGQVVGDNAIHRVMSKIRALGQTLGEGVFKLDTIPRVGYRLIAAPHVDKGDPAESSAASQQGGALSPAGAAPRRVVLALGLGGLAVAGGLATIPLRRARRKARRVADLIAQSEQVERMGMPDSEAQGVGFLEEAVSLEPNSDLAWGRLALARCQASEYAAPDEMAGAVLATQDAARRALALNRRQVDALAALALLPPYYGDWTNAEARMKSVLKVDPDHVPTRNALDFFYVAVGRALEGARDRLVYAVKEPLHATHQYRLIYAYWILNEIGEADRVAERAMQLWPKHPGVWLGRLWTLAFTGRADRALAQVQNASGRPDFSPRFVETLRLSMLAIMSRKDADIGLAIDRLLGLLNDAPSHSINAILILNGLGEIETAFSVAEAYLLERGPLMASVRWRNGEVSINDQRRRKTNMLFVPASAPMRADPRFNKLAADIGLAGYWTRAGVTPDYLAA